MCVRASPRAGGKTSERRKVFRIDKLLPLPAAVWHPRDAATLESDCRILWRKRRTRRTRPILDFFFKAGSIAPQGKNHSAGREGVASKSRAESGQTLATSEQLAFLAT